ncbi:MAG TPA: hypothetical protein DHW42_05855 [Candidatus Marinimicrobia bacterium]|nr:hypothetical protein [Candidatus Neomarinimicrobiota bacterium]
MLNILILSALSKELNPIRQYLESRYISRKKVNLNFNKISIGFKNDQVYVENLIREKSIWMVINAGTAGALDNSITINDIVFPRIFVKAGGKGLSGSDLLGEYAPIMDDLPNDWSRRILYTSGTAVTSAEGKRTIIAETGAQLVDMEAYWVAVFCQELALPFCALKVISDNAELSSIFKFHRNLSRVADKLAIELKTLVDLIETVTN